MKEIYISLDRSAWFRNEDSGLQLSINDENGGYRIFGPTYIGDSSTIIRRKLTKRDADQIRHYLDLIED